MSTATDPRADGAVDVAGQLRAMEETLVGLGPELVPERIQKHQLAEIVRSLGRIERCAAGARIVLTKAAAEAGAWKAQGFRSPAEWAARTNGTTVGQAAADLEASGQLEGLPATRDAAASGRLSPEATKAVAAGATADRAAESSLLAKGKAGDLTGARQEARKARQRADDRDGKAAERMYKRRQLRAWFEIDGEGRGQWNVPPAYQAVFLAALEPYRKEAFRQAHAAGQRPSPEALMADALQLLCLDTLHDLDLDIPDAARNAPHGPRPDAHGSHDAGSSEADPTPDDIGTAQGGGPRGRPHPQGAPANPHDASRPSPATTGPAGANGGTSSAAPGAAAPAGAEEADDLGSCSEPPVAEGATSPADVTDDPHRSEPSATSAGGRGATPGTSGDAPEPSLFDDHDSDSDAARPAEPHPDGRDHGPTRGSSDPSEKKPPRYRRRAPAQIRFHLEVAAWLRGHPQDDETCEVTGLGPMPITLARALANDAVLKLVLRDGADITTITSNRRHIPAALRTALEARDHECVVPDCHTTRGLQVDHITDFHKGGPTALGNNALLCVYHHYLKTHCHWTLRGPPGHWTFTPPDTS
ncbi:hypothetical protein BH24ACT4_BH24ACT4_10270 [soil metagenome]